jgi:hypothetical protein
LRRRGAARAPTLVSDYGGYGCPAGPAVPDRSEYTDAELGLQPGDEAILLMALLRELNVDMVLAGHRHVPYVWSIVGVRVIHSGTVSSLRLRGTMPPSYNLIEVGPDQVRVTMRAPGRRDAEEPLASFAREAVRTSRFYPAFERFVRFERLPFMDSSSAQGHAPATGGTSS